MYTIYTSLLYSSTMVIAGILISISMPNLTWMLNSSLKSSIVIFLLIISLTFLWSSIIAISHDDVKSIVAFSTVNQLCYMFFSSLVDPIITIGHIIVHALFKSIMFLALGSLIHLQNSHQSATRLRHSTNGLKTIFISAGSLLIAALSKETIILLFYYSISSLFVSMLLLLGVIFTTMYTLNIYYRTFLFSESIKKSLFGGFFFFGLLISAILFDLLLIEQLKYIEFANWSNQSRLMLGTPYFSILILPLIGILSYINWLYLSTFVFWSSSICNLRLIYYKLALSIAFIRAMTVLLECLSTDSNNSLNSLIKLLFSTNIIVLPTLLVLIGFFI